MKRISGTKFEDYGDGKELKMMDTVFIDEPGFPGTYVRDRIPCSQMPPTSDALNNVQCLNLISQGPGSFQRIGNKINLCKLDAIFTLEWLTDASFAEQPFITRLAIVYDKQPTITGFYPAVRFNDIFCSTPQNAPGSLLPSGVNYQCQDAQKQSTMNRFTVLWDTFFYTPTVTEPTTNAFFTNASSKIPLFKIQIDLEGLGTQYNSNSAPMTQADIQSGALFLTWQSNQPSGDESYQITGNVRVYYYDE